tara:strand:- start:2895 stop:3434 length:540 start_codon:yes stop_codon:yes gene_type:complete
MKNLFENWRQYLNESLAKQMTDKMHTQWLKDHRRKKGNDPKFKQIPGKPTAEQLKGYEGIKIEDGVAYQNINQTADKIVPSLNQLLNGGPAVDYAKVVESMPIKSAEDINSLASKFHEVWMKHNSWQKKDNPALFKPYESLPRDEKLKDLDQLKVALDLHYKGDPAVQQLFKQVYRSTT